MTTPEAAALYEAQHIAEHQGRGNAVFNPHGKPQQALPVIYGFNNGGTPGFLNAELIAADGTPLGGHMCSSESYMPHDLGILEGSRPDRHEAFRAHYPDGYRMEFVRYDEFEGHASLNAAVAKANAA